jgi:ribonuclease Z
MRLTLLGTTSMLPTRERAHSAHFLEYKGWGILFDCGEGTQRQLLQAGLSRQKTRIICLSHWHGDHAAGLIGLLQSIAGDHRPEDPPVLLIGPIGSEQYIHYLNLSMAAENDFRVTVKEVDAAELTLVFEAEDFLIHAHNLDHAVPTLGFSFEEIAHRNIDKAWLKKEGILPGAFLKPLKSGQSVEYEGRTIHPDEATYLSATRKFTYVADTRHCPGAIELAWNADLLLSEATHLHIDVEKAHDHFHMTARQAAEIARDAEAKLLVMTHFSARYENTEGHVAEAEQYFPNVVAGEDFMRFEIS